MEGSAEGGGGGGVKGILQCYRPASTADEVAVSLNPKS